MVNDEEKTGLMVLGLYVHEDKEQKNVLHHQSTQNVLTWSMYQYLSSENINQTKQNDHLSFLFVLFISLYNF